MLEGTAKTRVLRDYVTLTPRQLFDIRKPDIEQLRYLGCRIAQNLGHRSKTRGSADDCCNFQFIFKTRRKRIGTGVKTQYRAKAQEQHWSAVTPRQIVGQGIGHGTGIGLLVSLPRPADVVPDSYRNFHIVVFFALLWSKKRRTGPKLTILINPDALITMSRYYFFRSCRFTLIGYTNIWGPHIGPHSLFLVISKILLRAVSTWSAH